MLQVRNLTKKFGNRVAVKDLSFSVRRGEIVGFLGLNGAGKSTTMKMIAGFLRPDEGAILIDNVDMELYPIEAKSKLGYLPEGLALYGDMPVHSYLAFVARARGMRSDDIVESIAAVVQVLEIRDVLNQRISTLSKGYFRRVGLAQALLHDPDYLVLDEPTEGLDPKQREQVHFLIQQMAGTKAVIFSTHILEEVSLLSDRVIVIDKGKIIVDDYIESLLRMSNFHNSIRLKVSNIHPAEIENHLLEITELAGLQYEQDGSFRLVPKNLDSLVDRIWIYANRYDWDIITFVKESGDLESVFLDLTSDEYRQEKD